GGGASRGALARAAAIGAGQEYADQPARELLGDLAERHHPPRSRRALDGERGDVEVMVALERLDEQPVHGEPDRTAPVRVAAEEAGRRLAGAVLDRRPRVAEDLRAGAVPPPAP